MMELVFRPPLLGVMAVMTASTYQRLCQRGASLDLLRRPVFLSSTSKWPSAMFPDFPGRRHRQRKESDLPNKAFAVFFVIRQGGKLLRIKVFVILVRSAG